MSARFEWYGGQVIASVEAAKKTALTAACKIVQADAKADAPKNTGNLQGSITYKVSEDDGKVGTNVEYAIYQEYGFRHWRSGKFIQNAYLRPALDNNRAKIIKLINDFVGAAVKRGGKK